MGLRYVSPVIIEHKIVYEEDGELKHICNEITNTIKKKV